MNPYEFDDRGESSVRSRYNVICQMETGLLYRTFHASSPEKALQLFVETLPGDVEDLQILVSGSKVLRAFRLTRKTYEEYDEIDLNAVTYLRRLLQSTVAKFDHEARRFPPTDPDT